MSSKHYRQRTGLGDGGEIYILSPERQSIKELKYRISTKVHQRIFSPELLRNSEQKADKMHVCPAIAKPHVRCSTMSSKLFCPKCFSVQPVNEQIHKILVFKNSNCLAMKKLKNHKIVFLSTEKGKQKK